MDFAVIQSGRDQGTCGGGLGTNKMAYERASALALAISIEIIEGVYSEAYAQLHRTVMRLKERVAYMTPYAAEGLSPIGMPEPFQSVFKCPEHNIRLRQWS